LTGYLHSAKDWENRRKLVLVEKEGLAIVPIRFELFGIAKQIATDLGGVLCAVAIGHAVADISGQVSSFFDEDLSGEGVSHGKQQG